MNQPKRRCRTSIADGAVATTSNDLLEILSPPHLKLTADWSEIVLWWAKHANKWAKWPANIFVNIIHNLIFGWLKRKFSLYIIFATLLYMLILIHSFSRLNIYYNNEFNFFQNINTFDLLKTIIIRLNRSTNTKIVNST